MGRTCGTHGRGKFTRCWLESPNERDHWEDRSVDGIRMDLGEMVCGESVEWIILVQDSGQWRAVVNAVMKLRGLAPRS
jgi:hypothetical protein